MHPGLKHTKGTADNPADNPPITPGDIITGRAVEVRGKHGEIRGWSKPDKPNKDDEVKK